MAMSLRAKFQTLIDRAFPESSAKPVAIQQRRDTQSQSSGHDSDSANMNGEELYSPTDSDSGGSEYNESDESYGKNVRPSINNHRKLLTSNSRPPRKVTVCPSVLAAVACSLL